MNRTSPTFYICRTIPTTPGRFETQFWSTHNPGAGEGWTTDRFYAVAYQSRADAAIATAVLVSTRKVQQGKTYVSEVAAAL